MAQRCGIKMEHSDQKTAETQSPGYLTKDKRNIGGKIKKKESTLWLNFF